MLAKWCYPESFSSLDLAEEKRNLMRKLYGERPALLALLH